MPASPCFDQFRLRAAALRQHPQAISCGQMRGYLQQLVHGSNGSGGDHVIFAGSRFGLARGDRNTICDTELGYGSLEELGAQPARLDQLDRPTDVLRRIADFILHRTG